eukprot:439188-Amphidinium_carterae.1
MPGCSPTCFAKSRDWGSSNPMQFTMCHRACAGIAGPTPCATMFCMLNSTHLRIRPWQLVLPGPGVKRGCGTLLMPMVIHQIGQRVSGGGISGSTTDPLAGPATEGGHCCAALSMTGVAGASDGSA